MNARRSRTQKRAMKNTPRKALIGAAATALAACGEADIGGIAYGADSCRRVALTDASTGAEIKGAEDLALDAARGRLIISAYDRRAVEKAARGREDALPQGGLYAVALSDIFNTDRKALRVSSLIAPGDVKGGLRPHGLSYDAASDEIVFINRAYARKGRRWLMNPRIERRRADGSAAAAAAAPAPCAANDVLAQDAAVLASFDHGFCDWRAGLEDILGLKRSGFAAVGGAREFNGAAFANGLAQGPGGAVALGATRENAVLLIKQEGARAAGIMRIKTPGGPDNLTVNAHGDVIAAVHPSLFRLAMNRKLGRGKAPSRIVRIDLSSGRVDTLFDDNGALFSAATAAIETEFGLIIGSVTDSGLLVCDGAS